VVTGVSITVDAIYDLALEAIDNAKAGKFTALGFSADDLYSVSMTVSKKGVVSDLLIDVLQGKPSAGVFAWNTSTKQELGYEYKMFYSSYVASLTDSTSATIDGYKTWLTANSKLEWFEQVALITDYVMANGYSSDLATSSADALSGATITTTVYYSMLDDIFAYAGDSVK
ncbi:MAG: hypothetical protein WCR19_06260, partial [Acholeplasmataceae bacterium]